MLLLLFSSGAAAPAPVPLAPDVWPADVPQAALEQGYNETPERYIEEFRPQAGLPTLRRRTSIKSDLVTFASLMTFTEYDALMVFYRVQLGNGTSTFMRRHPRNSAGPMYEFEFTDMPKLRAVGPTFGEVSMTMRRKP